MVNKWGLEEWVDKTLTKINKGKATLEKKMWTNNTHEYKTRLNFGKDN